MIALLLAGRCAWAQGAETLLGFRQNEGHLIFRVVSHGCTGKPNFELTIEPYLNGAHQVFVTLWRRVPDNCKGFFRNGIEVGFTREELGLPPDVIVAVTNPRTMRPR